MEDPAKEFNYVKARTSTTEEKIEIAYNLVHSINFQNLIERLILNKDTTPLKIKLSFGYYKLVTDSREEKLKSLEFAFNILIKNSASKVELQQHLVDLADWIIYKHSFFQYLSNGEFLALHYEKYGIAWAKAETFIKYREIISNIDKPQFETITSDLPNDDSDSLHSNIASSNNEFYTEICEGLNFKSILDFIGKQTDLQVLGQNLEGQLAAYAKRCGEGFENHDAKKGDLWDARYYSRDKWLKHTIFICKDEYNRTKREIFNEAVKWCEDWKAKYLNLFNPYSPKEEASRHKDLFSPLWKQLNNETKPKAKPKPKKTYGWNADLTEIQKERLFTLLKKEGFIFDNTALVDFKSAFTFLPIPETYTPVVWARKQSDLIHLFIEKVPSGNRPKQPWVHFNKLFNIDAPGQLFNTKSLKNQFQHSGTPTKDLAKVLGMV